MKFVAAPFAAVALTVSGAGVASAITPGEIAGGLGSGMQIGGSLGQVADLGIGSAVGADDAKALEGIGALVGTLLGGSVGLLTLLGP